MTYFDDSNLPVEVTYPASWDEPEVSDADASRLRQEVLCRLVHLLASGRCGARTIGRRVLLLDHVLSRSTKPQKLLAKRLGVTEARVSEGIKRLKRGICATQGD